MQPPCQEALEEAIAINNGTDLALLTALVGALGATENSLNQRR
jgi:hypothetical protein